MAEPIGLQTQELLELLTGRLPVLVSLSIEAI
jgi:hypothetical protein